MSLAIIESKDPSGICYRCMFGEHKHCFGQDGACVCHRQAHDLERVLDDINKSMAAIGLPPMPLPGRLPEEPTDSERFFFSVKVSRL